MLEVRWILLLGITAACDSTPTSPSAELGTNASPVVYGEDDRDEVFEHGNAARVQAATGAVVALIDSSVVDASNPQNVRLPTETLGYYESLCAGQRFFDQPAPAFCSGTLIAPDLVLTAGHCVTSQAECETTTFVFDYRMESSTVLHAITSEDLYICASLVVQAFTDQEDYAVVRLDRPAVGRTPASVNSDAALLELDAPLWLAGFPSGLPMKITDGARVLENGSEALNYFIADFDTFAGNSGSGVFADESGTLVGVFNSGADDYVDNGGCNVVNVCAEVAGYCTGESSTYAFRAIEALCNSGASAPFCSCGDGVCATAEQGLCCTDCGCANGQLCRADACTDDPCSKAVAVEPVNATHTGTMSGARDDFTPAPGCSGGDGPDVAYSFTLTGATSLRATATGTDPVLMVMRADACGSSSQLACDDDGAGTNYDSRTTVELSPGTYVVIVDSYEEDEPQGYSLNLEFTAASGGSSGTSGTGSEVANAGAAGAVTGGGGGTNTGGSASGGTPSTGSTTATSGGLGGTESTGGTSGGTGGTSTTDGSGGTASSVGGSSGSGSTPTSGGIAESASSVGGSSGSGSTPTSGGIAESASSSATSGESSDDGCGCRMPGRAPRRALWPLALGLIGFGLARRRLHGGKSARAELS